MTSTQLEKDVKIPTMMLNYDENAYYIAIKKLMKLTEMSEPNESSKLVVFNDIITSIVECNKSMTEFLTQHDLTLEKGVLLKQISDNNHMIVKFLLKSC